MTFALRSALWLILAVSTLSADPTDETCTHRLIIMRHGESQHNITKTYNSDMNDPNYVVSNLTQVGQDQVTATANKLLNKGITPNEIIAVYVSPLPRAVQTVDVLARTGLIVKSRMTKDWRLTEPHVGDLEGKPLVYPWNSSLCDKYHVERDEQIEARVQKFLKEILAKNPCGSILIVTHGTIAEKLLKFTVGVPTRLPTAGATVVSLSAQPSAMLVE